MEEDFFVFVFGRMTFEDRYVKGFDIIAKAVASLGEKFKLTCVGAPPGKQRHMEKWFLKKTKITRDQLTIRGYCDQEELKGMFREAHLIALPSRAEGFGLVALEAISAGTPVLVSSQSGISTALQEVEDGYSVIVNTSQEPEEWERRIKELSLQTQQKRSDNAIRLREKLQKAEKGPSQDRLSQEVQNSTEKVIYGKGKRPLSATERTDDLQIKSKEVRTP
ncbi:hypothetical protein OS493_038837 [Desmophyllum pertusum]|uniref:Glycosyl transferase family 1 domain-containing protein n=1 Tax=Desmophyllum pertusum TaxID=174260 RepID=A0A9W9Y6U5_9CNID|nr:hypothetical protein OS493_038837 [Desmophyllum pertusum]